MMEGLSFIMCPSAGVTYAYMICIPVIVFYLLIYTDKLHIYVYRSLNTQHINTFRGEASKFYGRT